MGGDLIISWSGDRCQVNDSIAPSQCIQRGVKIFQVSLYEDKGVALCPVNRGDAIYADNCMTSFKSLSDDDSPDLSAAARYRQLHDDKIRETRLGHLT